MSPASWYAARAAGIVAYLLLSGSVVVGLSMSSKRKLEWPRFAVEELHRFLSLLTGLFIVIHGGSLLLDRVVPTSLTQLVVPFTSSYRPLTVGLGVAAADLLAAVALTNAAAANVASWRAPGAFDGDRTFPFGTFPADAAAMMNLSEVVVHTWDVANALGKDPTIDPAVAEMVYEFYRPMSLDPYRAHGAFGAEVSVGSDAPPAERLLALLGRRTA